jgi:hypothetical protein
MVYFMWGVSMPRYKVDIDLVWIRGSLIESQRLVDPVRFFAESSDGILLAATRVRKVPSALKAENPILLRPT